MLVLRSRSYSVGVPLPRFLGNLELNTERVELNRPILRYKIETEWAGEVDKINQVFKIVRNRFPDLGVSLTSVVILGSKSEMGETVVNVKYMPHWHAVYSIVFVAILYPLGMYAVKPIWFMTGYLVAIGTQIFSIYRDLKLCESNFKAYIQHTNDLL